MGLVFFSGRHRVDHRGAVSVVAANVFASLSKSHAGTLIGMGNLTSNLDQHRHFKQINLLPRYVKKLLFYRAIKKINYSFLQNPPLEFRIKKWIEQRQTILADKLAKSELQNLLNKRDDLKIALGFVGDSLEFGKLAKKSGLKYIVHSQFCHPTVQNYLVSEA